MLFEIVPELLDFVFVVGACSTSEGVLRGAANVAHGASIELEFAEHSVNVKLRKLECALIHAFLLEVVNLGVR